MNGFTDILNDDFAQKMASEILERLHKFKGYHAEKDIEKRERIGYIDYNFELSGGSVKSKDVNTWISFDPEKGSYCNKFIKSIYSEEWTPDEELSIYNHKKKIYSILKNEEYFPQIKTLIRDVIMPGTDEKIMPLSTIDIMEMEMIDYSSVMDTTKRTFTLIKLPGETIRTDRIMERIQSAQSASPELTINEAIHKERLAANPLFDAVLGAHVGSKYLWELTLSLYVDYSLQKPEEIK